MSLQHIQKNSPRLLPKPAKFEKNPPNGYRVIRKTKCGAGGAAGAGGAGSSPIHKQASLAGRLIIVRRVTASGFSRLTAYGFNTFKSLDEMRFITCNQTHSVTMPVTCGVQ